jgi:cyclophilin family peptidyl-prolyl cis-trans isomerase
MRAMLEALESRTLMTVTIDALPAIYGTGITLPAGKAIQVPLTSTNTLAGKVTYTVLSSNPKLVPLLNSINPAVSRTRTFVRFSTDLGNMDFQLFNDVAPETVSYLLSHLNSPDYVNSIFHRIIAGVIIQGGDRNGDGIDNNTGLALPQELHPRLMYTGHGQLGEARTQTSDTGGSQFFVTVGSERSFDFRYTIYGQLVRGWDVLNAINSVQTDGPPPGGSDRPLSPPVLNGISVLQDNTDAVMTVVSNSLTPTSGVIRVLAKDAFGHQAVRWFTVSTSTDTFNDQPFLPKPSAVNRAIPANVTSTVPIGSAIDVEGNPVTITGAFVTNPPHFVGQLTSNFKGLMLKPDAGYTGPIQVQVTAAPSSNPNDPNTQDTHIYTFYVDSGAAPTMSALPQDVYANAGGSYTFTVTYHDDTLLNAATLLNNNSLVTVMGPNGFRQNARYVSMTAGTDTRTVTYRITAPGFKWDARDAGAYHIIVNGGVVKDTLGHAAAAKFVGTFYYSPSAFFDERYYLAMNPDVAAAVRRGTYTSGWQHFNAIGQVQGRSATPYFNEKLYRQLYPAVDLAVRHKMFKSGWQHFILYGAKQGLVASPVFNESQYLEMYPDVKAAVNAKLFGSGFEHFILHGQFEGRKPSLYFDPVAYANANPVVATAVNAGTAGLARTVTEHFLIYGQKEGRQAIDLFSESYYLSTYPDVAAAVASGMFKSGFEHFILFGAREKRNPSTLFNSNFYLTTYPDVATAIANGTVLSAFEHFVRIGRGLGRLGHA